MSSAVMLSTLDDVCPRSLAHSVDVLTSRRLVAGLVRLALLEVGLPVRIWEAPEDFERDGVDISMGLIILDVADPAFDARGLTSSLSRCRGPIILVGASSFVTVQIRRQVPFPVDVVPDPFYVEELAAKLKLFSKEALPAVAAASPLTDRQTEVLALLARGLPLAVVAERCCVSVGTIKTHLRSILQRLGARNRAEAVAIAKDLSLL